MVSWFCWRGRWTERLSRPKSIMMVCWEPLVEPISVSVCSSTATSFRPSLLLHTRGRRETGLKSTWFGLGFLRMMLSCWLIEQVSPMCIGAVCPSVRWSVKWLGWESAASPRPWSSTAKGCFSLSSLGKCTPQVYEQKHQSLVHQWRKDWVQDKQVHQCSICSNLVSVLIHHGEEDRALSLPVSLCSYPHLWSWPSGIDQKNEIASARMNFFRRMAGRNLRDGLTQEELGVAPLLLHIKRSQMGQLGPVSEATTAPLMCYGYVPFGRRPERRPRTRWRDDSSWLVWKLRWQGPGKSGCPRWDGYPASYPSCLVWFPPWWEVWKFIWISLSPTSIKVFRNLVRIWKTN